MISENYGKVMLAIEKAAARSGRQPEEVKLVAVTKTVGVEEVRLAASLGISDFGENRVQDAVEKVKTFPQLKWHFIGHLQSNKVKDVLPYYVMIHSLDRLSLAGALQRWAERMDRKVEALVQVNVSGEESKFGLLPEELSAFLTKLKSFDRLNIRGLMTMAPFFDDPEDTRPCFRLLRQLRDESVRSGFTLADLSMGMTNDYVVAVEEGATIVRIGSALFA
ncbi:MAG: YggS family pyridoxal phosphate-dependent enzyme [Bacillota bacterium]